MTQVSLVAILGLGSRGLSVLERIVTLAKRAGPSAGPVLVDVVDPTCGGAGVHHTGQPDYLLLNTTCSQVSMFPDSCTVGPDVDEPGPSLHEWVTARGLRIGADGFTVGGEGRPIRPTDFLPRRVLGEYLSWFGALVQRRAPEYVHIQMHRATAVDLDSTVDGELSIALSDGSHIRTRNAFLTTGYTPNSAVPDGRRQVADPYPLPARLAQVAPGETVAIGGFGLSAMDTVSCLTVGRGGSFAGDLDRLTYIPSGREPAMLVYSRTGVPCRPRPLVVRFDGAYEPLVFTRAGIDDARAMRRGPLDFDADVLPLVLAEMRIAYRRCEARLAGGEDAEQTLVRNLTAANGAAGILAVLDELDAHLGPFDAYAALDGSTGMRLDDSAAYQDWLAGVVRRDLAEGIVGLARSPRLAALDVVRTLRDVVRYAVDFGGLTATSLDEFTRRTVPTMNRAAVGPQFERYAELLTLMSCGLLAAPFGPAPTVDRDERTGRWTIASSRLTAPHARPVDWIVSGHVPLPAVESSTSPLISSMYRKSWIRPHRPDSRLVHGIDVDPDQHPLDPCGRPDRRLWFLGPLCEGATFYNNLVPSPGVWSRPIHDAHRCVAAMFAAE